MVTKVAEASVANVVADVIVLGWAGQFAEEVSAIKSEVKHYVANAFAEGFSPREMLDDVLVKYRAFFGPVGEVDRMDLGDRTVLTFFLSGRRGH